MSIRQYVKVTPVVSNEGIFDGIKQFFKKRGTEKASKNTPEVGERFNDLQQWYMNEFEKNYKEYAPTGDTVEMSNIHAPFFANQNGALFDDLVGRLDADIKAYTTLIKTTKPVFDRACRHLQDTAKKFDAFTGDADRLEEFVKVFEAAVKTQPELMAAVFREPSHEFMGYGKGGFVADKHTFNDSAPKYSIKGSVAVPVLTKEKLTAFVKAVSALSDISHDLFMINNDAPLGLDFTDPPTRGYSDDDQVQDLTNKAHFFHPVFEEGNTDLYLGLVARVDALLYAMLVYLRRCVG
jgi:hypothetical protein